MTTLTWLVIGIAGVAVAAALYWFNKETGADVDGDGDVDLKDLTLAAKKTKVGVEKTVKETKQRAKRVKEELADVTVAVKEAAKQSKDVVAAAKGKKRTGPKKLK